MQSGKKGYCIYETFFCIKKGKHTHTHTHTNLEMKCITLKKEDTEEKIIEYHQTKTTHRNKREKKHGDIELPENKK